MGEMWARASSRASRGTRLATTLCPMSLVVKFVYAGIECVSKVPQVELVYLKKSRGVPKVEFVYFKQSWCTLSGFGVPKVELVCAGSSRLRIEYRKVTYIKYLKLKL